MSGERVVFDDEFFSDVYRRAAQVREMALGEIVQAEEMLLGETAEVLPLFTETFWSDVKDKADRVRAIAAADLADAERSLEAPVPVGRSASRWHLSPQGWARVQGFAMALIAVLALLPQIVPVISWATGAPDDPSSPIAGLSTSDGSEPDASQPAAASSGGTGDRGTSTSRSDAGNDPDVDLQTPTGEGGSAGTAVSGGDVSSGGESGQSGASATGATGVGALKAPDDVTIRAAGPSALRITWTDRSSDEVGFEIQRAVPAASDEDSRSVAEDRTGFTWRELEPGSTECFRVRAVGAAKPSKWVPDNDSGYACAGVPAPAPSPSPSPSPEPSPAPSPAASPAIADPAP